MGVRRWSRLRSAPARLILGILAAASLAGCSSASSSSSSAITAKGQTLVVFLSEPRSPDPVQRQVLEAEQLACGTRARPIRGSRLSVRCEVAHGRELSAGARTAIQDESAIGYIGELEPGTSEQTTGITNALDLPELSPTDTAVELTNSTPAVPGAPATFFESAGTYGRTFARIVPTSAEEASALTAEMKKLGVHGLWVSAGDGSDYARALAAAVRGDARSQGITLTSSEASAAAAFWAGDSPEAARRYAQSASSTASTEKLFLPSALDGLDFAGAPWTRFSKIFVSYPSAPAAAARAFTRAFSAAEHASPMPEAAFGYAAVQVMLHVLDQAGSHANDRATVVRDLLRVSGVQTAVGTVTINSHGDSSLGPSTFVVGQVKGRRLVPVGSTQH